MNNIHEIWLAGGCFWGAEEYFSRINGVIKTDVGYANGKTKYTRYLVVSITGHAETVHLTYDINIISLKEILEYYFKIIDPTSTNKQGNDIGRQYRTGVYYKDELDLPIIQSSINEEQKKYDKPIVTEVLPLNNYIKAENYHQSYLKKNPHGYCHIDLSLADKKDNPYKKLTTEAIKKNLTDIQYKVTQLNDTEQPFNNEYWDNHEKGIYVDVVTREPLFVSTDKFESGCGWPSFTKPISDDLIIKKEDNSVGMIRMEVRSSIGDSHLGHVFEDGPISKGGLRYCINSASLKFIPLSEMENKGYKDYIHLIK
jgi:peptide methionine sulfoxide reductase msrA/msrB